MALAAEKDVSQLAKMVQKGGEIVKGITIGAK